MQDNYIDIYIILIMTPGLKFAYSKLINLSTLMIVIFLVLTIVVVVVVK